MKKTVGDPGYRAGRDDDRGVGASARTVRRRRGRARRWSRRSSDYGGEARVHADRRPDSQGVRLETGHHKYAGSVADVIGKAIKTGQSHAGKYQADADAAQKYDEQLEHIVKTYPSLEWVPAAIARQGSVYDALRTGLYNAVPPSVKYFTPQQDALLKRLEGSGSQKLQDQADDLRTTREGGLAHQEGDRARRGGRDHGQAVRRGGRAGARSTTCGTRRSPTPSSGSRTSPTSSATRRCASTSRRRRTRRIIGAHRYLTYTDGMYVQSRPGLTATPAARREGTRRSGGTVSGHRAGERRRSARRDGSLDALRAGLTALCLVAAIPFVVAACGGEETKPPVTPTAPPTRRLPPQPRGPAAAPTAHADVERRRQGLYDRGYAAFLAGDLQAAKQAFTRRLAGRPARPAPHYSLGVVLERLGDVDRRAAGVPGRVHRQAGLRRGDRRVRAVARELGHDGGGRHLPHEPGTRRAPDSAPIATFLAR